MKRKSIIALSLLLLFVVVLVIYRIDQNGKKKELNSGNFSNGAKSIAKIFGKVIYGQPFSDYISLSGSIEANEQVNIHPEISGIVETINFKEGSYVAQGQVLVQINDAELRAQLEQAKTKDELSAENERRAKLLLEKEAISQEEYDIASADYRTTQSQIQLIRAQLDKTVIRAPFSGIIGLRNVSKGSYIAPTINIAQLVNTAQVKLLFAIPEKYAYMAKRDKLVRFTVQGTDVVYTAKIYATEPAIEANTRTLLVRAIAENPSNSLIPGTFASITFPLDDVENGLLVPAEALIPIQNGKKLFVIKEGKAKEVLVKTGGRTASEVLITQGIYEGDTVLTSGVMSLRDGADVEVNLR